MTSLLKRIVDKGCPTNYMDNCLYCENEYEWDSSRDDVNYNHSADCLWLEIERAHKEQVAEQAMCDRIVSRLSVDTSDRLFESSKYGMTIDEWIEATKAFGDGYGSTGGAK